MSLTSKDFQDPSRMIEVRARTLRVRIQTLESDLVVMQHPFSRAVVKQEINKCIDEYVARTIQ